MTAKQHKDVPAVVTVPSEDETDLSTYAQEVNLPLYAAPVEPTLSFPLVRYAKGVMVVSGVKPQKYTGWHIGTEQSAELDSLFEAMGVPAVRVRHQKGNEESYWQLDTIKGYILCTAVPESYGPDAWRKTGIPYVWNEHEGTYAFGSQLQALFFMKGLLELGYTAPLVLTFSRTVTELFIHKVLQRQAAMLEAVKKVLRKQGKPDQLAFYAYWLELVKSPEEFTTRGGGSYFPPAMALSAPLTVSYVREHQTPMTHVEIIESFLPMLPEWAEATSAKLLEPPRENGTPAPEEPDQQAEPPAAE